MSTLLDSAAGAEVIPATETLPIVPQTGKEKALAYAHGKYRTGEWRWVQGHYRRGESGRCLYQAIVDAGHDVGTSSLGPLLEIQNAVGLSIPGWNDSPNRTFDDILDVLERTIIGVRKET